MPIITSNKSYFELSGILNYLEKFYDALANRKYIDNLYIDTIICTPPLPPRGMTEGQKVNRTDAKTSWKDSYR